MKWFRYHTDALNNPKVQSLPGELFKAWVNLLSVTSQCDGALPSRDEIAFHLRMSRAESDALVDQLIERELLDVEGEEMTPHNWEKHQYSSDSSKERTKKYRAKKKAESDGSCDVTVTPPDTDTDTEQKEKEVTNVTSKKTAGAEKPKKITLEEISIDHVRDWLAEKRVTGRYLTIDEHALLDVFKDYCRAKNPKYRDYVAAFRNSFNWDNAPKKGEKNGTTQKLTHHERLKNAGDIALEQIYADIDRRESEGLAVEAVDRAKLPDFSRLRETAGGGNEHLASLCHDPRALRNQGYSIGLPDLDENALGYADPGADS